MPTISLIIQHLESIAPPAYQENYDNSGLITGDISLECTGIICTLDATEAVVEEACKKGANLIIAHHPILFAGTKSIRPDNYVGRALISAIKNDIAIYAIHTNLDNILSGVSGKMAEKLELTNVSILEPAKATLSKIQTFVPADHLEAVRTALFSAGAGNLGNYSECSFSTPGEGTFKANDNADPFVGKSGERHTENEFKIELIFPSYLTKELVKALKAAHPYEEVAYDIIPLSNTYQQIGSGIIGELPQPVPVETFLHMLSQRFNVPIVRHTDSGKLLVQRVALCGGAGSFLIKKALAAQADVFVSADIKYHEFFDGGEKLMICDIGHFESEQYTIELLHDILVKKFPTFAVLKSEVETNPVHYFIA